MTDAGPLNIGRGRLIPTTSWDAIFNAVAEWAGVTDEADMAKVLPNRNNFNRLFTRGELFAPDPISPDMSPGKTDKGNEAPSDEGEEECSLLLKDLINKVESKLGQV